MIAVEFSKLIREVQRGSNAVVASSAGKKPPVEEPPVRAQLARNGLTWQEGASSG